ncbi:Fic family protein [Candidatus Dependentiae bacterium]
MNRSGKYVSQMGRYKAFVPSPLPPDPAIKIEGELKKLLKEANLVLAKLDGFAYAIPNVDLFIGMYVKKEALLSTQIEGTQASLEDVFAFEATQDEKMFENINDIEEVVNYIKSLNYGIKKLEKFPMSLRLIKELHKILLQGVRGHEKTPGEFKRTQNWIGPAGCTLQNAKFVPPSPQETLTAMGDLEMYMHSGAILPELVDCALIHYQFETIHPFLDGNGRLGRLLITFYLFWKGLLKRPLLYLSYYLKKNRQEYYDRLGMVRKSGDYEQWVTFFLQGVIETADLAIEDAKKILSLQERHRKLLLEKNVSSQFAHMLLEKLFYTPYVSVKDVQNEFGIHYQSAANLIAKFQAIGILKEITGKKRGKRFAYKKYLEILQEGTKPL